jgi:hypothetical protein
MRILLALLVWLVLAPTAELNAIPDRSARPVRFELLVFEHPDCRVCPRLRQELTSFYAGTGYAVTAPLRFVDITASDIAALALQEPLRVVPTTVLMRDGSEVDRICGYWSPANFRRMLASLLARA